MYDTYQEELTLPGIKASVVTDANNRRRLLNNRRDKSPLKKKEDDNLFIYKDFDTSLTAVKGNIRKLPVLQQTTAQRGQDMIRDRLLSFNVRNGSLAALDRSERKGPTTMIERSEALKKRKLSESHANLQKHMRPKLSNNMRQKAYWVQNQYESNIILPDILNTVNKSQNVSPRGSVREVEENKRMSESMNPVPISKEEKLTTSETDGDMKLVQQYVMIRGRLQPALKYVAQIPMFNRYKVKNSTKDSF